MTEAAKAEPQHILALSETCRRVSGQGNGNAAAEHLVGLKKRRPASPEVVISARPRTPASNGDTSFEQSQSPTKKQRTEQKALGIVAQNGDGSVFAAQLTEGSIEGAPKTPSKTTTDGPADAGLIFTTETFAQLSTVTPRLSSPDTAKTSSQAESSRPGSKRVSPSSRRQSNVIVEIPLSRQGTASARTISQTRTAERQGKRTSRPSTHTAISDEPVDFAALQAADDDLFSSAPSPELEEVPSSKARSRAVSPKLSMPSTSLPSEGNGSSTSLPTGFLSTDLALPGSSHTSNPEAGPSDEPQILMPDTTKPFVDSLSPSKMFINPNDPWFAKPSRYVATKKKQYAEESSEEVEDEDYVTVSANKPTPGRSKAAPHGAKKGKEREIDSEAVNPSEDIAHVQVSRPEAIKTPAKKQSKQRNNKSASAQSAALSKSKSDSHLTGKGKAKSRRKGSTSSGTSDPEDVFGLHSPSPSKRRTTVRKKTTSPKKVAAARSVKPSHLSTKPVSVDTSDDDLPTLPFSSQPPPQSQATVPFDLLDIDDIAFVAVPALRKSEAQEPSFQREHHVHFWWPARIINRNRKNFTVSLIFGETSDGRDCFQNTTFAIAEEDLDADHLRKLSSHCNPFPSSLQAYEAISTHSQRQLYTVPSGLAYASALRNALKREKDIGTSVTNEDANAVMHSPTEESDGHSNASELDLLIGRHPVFSSDTEDDEAVIQVGTVGLGKNRNVWWPCRIVSNVTQGGRGGQAAGPKDRRRPYKVEFYPKSTALLSRKDIMLKSDPDFFTVPLGEVRTSEVSSSIPAAALRGILPEMARTASGTYPADRKRHAYFVDGTATEKTGLSRMAVYGQFERKQVDQLSDFLLDWAFGRSMEAVTMPSDAPFRTLASDEQKSNYVALVLLPVALELLVIKDDPEVDRKAVERLKQAGNMAPTDTEIRIMAHTVAAEDLEASSDWWDSILTLRRAHQTGNFVKQAMRTELDDEDLAAMGLATRRRKVNVNYKE